MSIDHNKVLFLQYDKRNNVWQEVTSNISAYKMERNACLVQYASSTKWYPKSYRDIRILDNPQRVNIEGDENLKLYFRVGQVYMGAKVVVECDGNILSSRKKVKLAPGEMENVTITPEMLKNMTKDSEIIVRIEQ